MDRGGRWTLIGFNTSVFEDLLIEQICILTNPLHQSSFFGISTLTLLSAKVKAI